MSKYKSQGFNNTFKNAGKGVRIVFKSEKNIRVHFIVGILVIIFAFLLGLSIPKVCILLLTIGFVIVAEMINSAVEFSLDAVFKNKYNKLVGMAKDISAGAVMLATVISVSVGIMIFGSEILKILH